MKAQNHIQNQQNMKTLLQDNSDSDPYALADQKLSSPS